MQQAQILKQIPKPARETETDLDLDLFAGLAESLTDPFNVFARVEDLENPEEPYVYFYAYTLGRKKVLIWGVYEKDTGKILIDEACRYHPQNLRDTQKIWKDFGNYKYVFNSVKDRFSARIEMLSRAHSPEAMVDFPAFREQYLLLRALHPYEGIDIQAAGLSPDDLEDLSFKYDITEADADEIIDNLIILRREVAPRIYHELSKYLTDDNYRVAKYLIKLHTNGRKLDQELQNRLAIRTQGSFLDLLLKDLLEQSLHDKSLGKSLGGPFKSYAGLIKKYLIPQVQIYEKNLNRTDLGSIGSLSRHGHQILHTLSQDFEDWVSRSKFNRRGYIETIRECPEPQQCEPDIFEDWEDLDPECASYYHGSLFRSEWESGLV